MVNFGAWRAGPAPTPHKKARETSGSSGGAMESSRLLSAAIVSSELVNSKMGWRTAKALDANGIIGLIEERRREVGRQCCSSTMNSIIKLIITLTLYVVSGVLFYHFENGWSYLDSIYFCAVTLSTVGYGGYGLEPDSTSSRLFTMGYSTLVASRP